MALPSPIPTPGNSPQPMRLEMSVTSDPHDLAPVRKAIEALTTKGGFDEKTVGDVGLVVNEALANVMRHAYKGAENRPIRVMAEVAGETLTIRIRDWGTGVNPTHLIDRPKDLEQPGGLGLICMRRIMDDVVFTPQPDGMLLTLTRRRDGAPFAGEKCIGT